LPALVPTIAMEGQKINRAGGDDVAEAQAAIGCKRCRRSGNTG
jgi:hypothetical protein